jgi:ribosomal protein L34
MNVVEARYEGNSKFMWDGEIYGSSPDAENKKKAYEEKGFETRMFNEEGKYLLYTRREVKEIVLDGAAPT